MRFDVEKELHSLLKLGLSKSKDSAILSDHTRSFLLRLILLVWLCQNLFLLGMKSVIGYESLSSDVTTPKRTKMCILKFLDGVQMLTKVIHPRYLGFS